MILILWLIFVGLALAHEQIEYSHRDLYETSKFNSSVLLPTVDLTKYCANETYIVNKVLNLNAYNKHRLPDANGVDVRVEFWIQVCR